MTTQPQAQLYLADQRGCSQTDLFRSYHTFNAGSYQVDGREPFGALYRFDDTLLAPGSSFSVSVEADTVAVLIPVTGGLATKINAQAGLATDFLVPGQVRVSGLTAGLTYTISNPYETEYINFLHIGLQLPAGNVLFTGGESAFDLTQKNRLMPLWNEATVRADNRGFIGQYDGRQEGVYKPKHPPEAGLFIFVLKGVFEVANRLLHEKDSLALWHLSVDTIEFEALSNEAILLLIDLPDFH